ncbi:MAG: ABC transporter permease [Verrucomicrobiia bacterium]|jgi:ABC-2 type transport system permease protein
MERFIAIVIKEFRQILRDRLSLGMLIIVPALLLVLYGYALSFDVKHIPTAALDEDRTKESREFLEGIFQNPYFTLKAQLNRRSEIDELLMKGKAKVAIVVPRGFSEKINRGESATIQALIDGADSTTGSTVHGYLDLIAARFNRRMVEETFAVRGGAVPLVRVEPRIWFNPNLESSVFLVPGLIAMFLMLSSVIAASLSIVRERERRTMEQIMVSPIRPIELIIGKTVPYILICVLTMVMTLLLGYLLFDVVVRGSYVTLSFATLLFLFASLGQGMIISALTNSQQVALQVATITTLLPSIVLSGLVFPIKNMPQIIQALTLVIIPRHFVTILRGVIIRGAGIDDLWLSFLAMFLIGLVFNLVAIIRMRKLL